MKNKREHFGLLIEEWKRSGLSQREFCDRNGVKLSTLQYWVVKGNREKAQGSRSLVEIAPAKINEPEGAYSTAIVLVVGRHRIAIGRGFDGQVLEELIGILEHRDARG